MDRVAEPRRAHRIGAARPSAARAVAPRADIGDRAEVPVIAGPGEILTPTGTGRRVARVARARIAVVAVHGRMRTGSGRRVAEVLGAEIAVRTVQGRTFAAERRTITRDAPIAARAGAAVVARHSQSERVTLTRPTCAADISIRAGIPIVARLPPGQNGFGQACAAGADLIAGAGVAIVTRGSFERGREKQASLRRVGRAGVLRARVAVVAGPRVVTASPRRRVACIDCAWVEVVARWTFRGGRRRGDERGARRPQDECDAEDTEPV
jgi:hypothetical protein